MLAYTVSFIDRMLLNLLVDHLRQDLALTDTQIGLLQGLAFAIVFSVLGLPVAWLADRKSRRNIITVGIVLWCVATALCGLSQNYRQLFAARVLVGVGEAALSPAAYSIIADYFPPSQLARATGTYGLAPYAGAGVAMLVGGVAISALDAIDVVTLPLIGPLRPWQLAFMVVGLPGLVIAALMFFTVREPERSDASGGAATTSSWSSNEALISFLRAERRKIAALCGGVSSLAIVMIALLSWAPTYLIRVHGWSVLKVGYRYGMVLVIFGTLGSVAGGWVADRLHERGVRQATLRTTVAVGALALPFLMVLGLDLNEWQALAAVALATFLLSAPTGLCAAAIQAMTPAALRSQMTAIYLLPVVLIGTGAGPLFVALCTEYVFSDPMAIGKSLAVVGGVFILLGVAVLWYWALDNRTLDKDK